MSREIRPAPMVLIQSADPYKLRALLRREAARRSVIVRAGVTEVRPGLWAAEVVQLRPIRAEWVRPALVAGSVVAVLGGAAFLGWLLLSAVVAVVASVSLAAVLGLATVAWLVARLAGGGRQVDVHVRVRG